MTDKTISPLRRRMIEDMTGPARSEDTFGWSWILRSF